MWKILLEHKLLESYDICVKPIHWEKDVHNCLLCERIISRENLIILRLILIGPKTYLCSLMHLFPISPCLNERKMYTIVFNCRKTLNMGNTHTNVWIYQWLQISFFRFYYQDSNLDAGLSSIIYVLGIRKWIY